MKFHAIGKWSDRMRREMEKQNGTSLAVTQFMELARGERSVQVPANEFQVETIRAEEHYCLRCFGVRWFDVIYANSDQVAFSYRRCRCCGKESGG